MEVIIKVSDDRHTEDDAIIFPPLQGAKKKKGTVQCHWDGVILDKTRETNAFGQARVGRSEEYPRRQIADPSARLHQPSVADSGRVEHLCSQCNPA